MEVRHCRPTACSPSSWAFFPLPENDEELRFTSYVCFPLDSVTIQQKYKTHMCVDNRRSAQLVYAAGWQGGVCKFAWILIHMLLESKQCHYWWSVKSEYLVQWWLLPGDCNPAVTAAFTGDCFVSALREVINIIAGHQQHHRDCDHDYQDCDHLYNHFDNCKSLPLLSSLSSYLPLGSQRWVSHILLELH